VLSELSTQKSEVKKTISIKLRLILLLMIVVLTVILLSVISNTKMQNLGKLQDEGYTRSEQAILATKAANIDESLYTIIADAVINHDMAKSEALWNKEKPLKLEMMAKLIGNADTPEEKQWASESKAALDSFINVFENEMLPILKSSDFTVDKIQLLDSRLDGYTDIMTESLEKYSSSLNAESVKGNDIFDAARASAIRMNVIISVVATVLMIGLCLLIILSITKPIAYIVQILDRVADGDISLSLEEKYKTSDEIGSVIISTDKMVLNLREIINGVIDESNNVRDSISDSNKQMSYLMQQIEEISATTEELSAGMEETAASAEEMSASSTEIGKAAESVAAKATEGSAKAREITIRANSLKTNAVLSQNQADDIFRQTQSKLVEAIEQSKKVDEINILSNAILGITSQTNLLALNAAIEAARAGEAGRGFAVVAEEIRKLAVASSTTVTQIQSVTKSVIAAVENLASNSREMLDFIDQQVIKDYQVMVETGEQYNEDANYVGDLVTNFSATSEELLALTENMLQAIDEVAKATNEGASGTTEIAEKTTVIVQKADAIVKLSNSAGESAEKLNELVSIFKV